MLTHKYAVKPSMLKSKYHCPMGDSVDLLLTLAAPELIATFQTKITRDTLRARCLGYIIVDTDNFSIFLLYAINVCHDYFN